MRLLTASEAADYLRMGERKLYELVAERAVPCTKVSGKWLFPREELDRWLLDGMNRPASFSAAPAPPIVGGSQDSLLEWALRESGSGLASLPEGSEAGFARLLRGEVAAAAIHYHSMDGDDEAANVDLARATPGLHDAVLIAFARREQGLLLAPGNPLGVAGIQDALAGRARMALRQKGAGAQMLLEALLARAGAGLADLNAPEPPCLTGPEVAQAIRAGRADCGLATRAAANAAGLDFAPLMWERFDLLMRQSTYFRTPVQALARYLASPAMVGRAREFGGYDVSDAGAVRWAP